MLPVTNGEQAVPQVHKPVTSEPVLVTGGAGFIGSHVVEALLARGASVRVLDDFSTGRLDHLPLHDPNLELCTGDVVDPAAVSAAARGVQACIHLAAQPLHTRGGDDPYDTILGNIQAAISVFEAARRRRVRRVLFASSAAVYGEASGPPFSEQTVPRPLAASGMEKLVVEGYAEMYRRRYGLQTLGLRYFNVYGPRQEAQGPGAGVIPAFLRQLEARRPVRLHGDGFQTRDYIHVEDAAAATLAALNSGCQGALNIASGEGTDTRSLVALLGSTLGMQPLMQFVPALPDEPAASWANVDVLRKTAGFVPARSLRTGLAELASDYEARLRLRERAASPHADHFVAH